MGDKIHQTSACTDDWFLQFIPFLLFGAWMLSVIQWLPRHRRIDLLAWRGEWNKWRSYVAGAVDLLVSFSPA